MKDHINKRIGICFRKNDVRCVYGSELDEEIVYRIGRAVVEYLKCKEFVVGYDFRVSSESLKKSFMRGLTDSGANVINIGMVDTPAVYFASGFLKKPSGMITASHNPAKYNGIKLSRVNAIPIGEKSGLTKIRELAQKNNFPKRKKGKIISKNILNDYVKHVRAFVNLKNINNIKIVVDAGNGMAGKMVPLVFNGLKVKIIPLDFKISGKQKHTANPSEYKNIKDLVQKVNSTKADFGIAFDGDMDRVFFVCEKGKIIDSSIMAALIIDNINKPRVVYNSAVGKIVPEITKKKGGKAFLEKVGHSFIKPRMKKVNADFGCEHSAHYYYKRNYYADSGLITSIIISEIMSKAISKGKKFSEVILPFEKYAKSEEKSLKVKDKQKIIKKIENKYKSKAKKISKLDGITMDFGNYWFNVRQSNTEPLLRLNIEANNKKILNQKLKEILSFIKNGK